jgi:hypothetical protein
VESGELATAHSETDPGFRGDLVAGPSASPVGHSRARGLAESMCIHISQTLEILWRALCLPKAREAAAQTLKHFWFLTAVELGKERKRHRTSLEKWNDQSEYFGTLAEPQTSVGSLPGCWRQIIRDHIQQPSRNPSQKVETVGTILCFST